MRAAALILVAASACAGGHRVAAQTPQRVVSLNPCIDTILVEIAPREQITALSHYSRDPHRSTIAELAKSYPVTYETAEEIVLLRPDLVLASRHSALATRNALRRVGIRTIVFDVPDSVEAGLMQMRAVAAAIGRQPEAETLIARLRRSMMAAQAARDGRQPTALIFQPGGLTAGTQTLPGELMRMAGLRNAADSYGVADWAPIALEQVIANPPDILLVGEITAGGLTWSERLIRHRALRSLGNLHLRECTAVHSARKSSCAGRSTAPGAMVRSTFPARLLYCGGPVIEHALGALRAARETALSSAPSMMTRRSGTSSVAPRGGSEP